MKKRFFSICLSLIVFSCLVFSFGCGGNSNNNDMSDNDDVSSGEVSFDNWVGDVTEECYLGDKYSLSVTSVTGSNNKPYKPKYKVVTKNGKDVEILNNQFLLYNVDGYKITYTISVFDKTFVRNVNVNVVNNIKPVISNTFAFDGKLNVEYTLPEVVVADAFSKPINEYSYKLYRKNGDELVELEFDTTTSDGKIVRTFTPVELATYVVRVEAEFAGNKVVKDIDFYVGNDNSRYEVRNFDNPNESRENVDFKFIPTNGTVTVDWLPEFEGKRGVLKVSYSDGGNINFAIKPKQEQRIYEGNWQNLIMEIFVPESKDCSNRVMFASMQWADELHNAPWLDFKDGRWSNWEFGKDRFIPNFDAMANLNTSTGKMYFQTENNSGPGVIYIAGFYQKPM